MKSLPTELVQSIAALCTPQRRGALLQTCRKVSADIRPTVQSCTVHLGDDAPGPPLPSVDRFENLGVVNVVCTPAAAQGFTGPIAQFSSRQGRVTFHFCDSSCTILGATGVRFTLDEPSDVATACRLTARCEGVHEASYEGDGHLLHPLASDSMRELRLYDVVFGRLELPALTLLVVQAPARVVHALLGHLHMLTVVVITADALCPCFTLPASVMHLVLEAGQPQELALPALPRLLTLSLTNVVTAVDLSAECPELHRLELIDSYLEGASPEEVLDEAFSHPSLIILVVCETTPPTHRLDAWRILKDEFDGLGQCEPSAVQLQFSLY